MHGVIANVTWLSAKAPQLYLDIEQVLTMFTVYDNSVKTGQSDDLGMSDRRDGDKGQKWFLAISKFVE
jgi:hypothetical protein